MKSVLIAIQPYWVFLIIAKQMGWDIPQEKTVEVRKSFPKNETWDKRSFIYCSRDKKSFNRIPKEYQPLMSKLLGKVIGEFVCDEIRLANVCLDNRCGWYVDNMHAFEGSCLDESDILSYCPLEKTIYGWHISELNIYDDPRGLNDFIIPSKFGCCNEGKCKGCEFFDRGNGFNVEDDCNAPFSTDEYKPLRKPPQSWCYVEEIKK